MDNFNQVVSEVCTNAGLKVTDFEVYNGSLFYTAPMSVSRKVFSNLMQAFDFKCKISKIEMDTYVVDFVV
jgi:hypothetical protein